MADCQNFFDKASPSRCRSSDLMERSSAPATTSVANDDCDDHRLELRLGPSNNANKPKQHEMVRPIALYPSLDKQRSGNLAHAVENSPLFRGHSDMSMTDKALFSKDSAFTTPPRISREQVWQTLQKPNAVLGQDVRISKDICDDAASSMWGRRSLSMQVVIPSSEMSVEVGECRIRRSCSNGVTQELLSRQSSFGREALIDDSPDATSFLPYNQQHEALELQKKKEMQAQRRLEARKRRRLLIEGKQQKKARQNSGIHKRQCISRIEKVSVVGACAMGCNCTLDPHHKPRCEALSAKLGDDEGRKPRNQGKDVRTNETASALLRCISGMPSDEEDVNNHTEKMMHKECDSTSSGGNNVKGDLISVQNAIASCYLSARAIPRSNNMSSGLTGKDVDTSEGVKFPPSSCSETESIETKGTNTCKELEGQSSSQRSSSERHLDYGGLSNVPPPTTASGKSAGLQSLHLVSIASKASEVSGTAHLNGFAIKKSVGVFSEGKWRITDEKSAFSSIRRTISNINQAVTEPQCSAKHLETRNSLSASQLKFARMVFDSTADASFKNRTNEMCGKLSCANGLDAHKMYAKNQYDSYTEEEKPIIGLKVDMIAPGMTHDTQVVVPEICRVKIKQEEGSTEERSFESHFVSKDREANSNVIQCGVINRQRSASYLDFPWVTTTGRGPNGKTINGVMYIASGQCVRLVCRCHGKHMSPAEFVEHSGSTDLSNPLRSIVVNPFPLFNQLATTPV